MMRHVAMLFAAVTLAACTSAQTNSAADAGDASVVHIPVSIDIEGKELTFQAEIADTPEERSQGLMFRKSMGDHEGMLFLFPSEQQLSFWMRNTLIPLDMIFIRADHTILGIVENAAPQTDAPRAVPGQSQYVLELNGGASAAMGIKAGQELRFYAPVPSR